MLTIWMQNKSNNSHAFPKVRPAVSWCGSIGSLRLYSMGSTLRSIRACRGGCERVRIKALWIRQSQSWVTATQILWLRSSPIIYDKHDRLAHHRSQRTDIFAGRKNRQNTDGSRKWKKYPWHCCWLRWTNDMRDLPYICWRALCVTAWPSKCRRIVHADFYRYTASAK